MGILEKIKQEELEKYKENKDLNSIPLKANVSVQYLNQNKDKRIFRGIVIAKASKGINSEITVIKTDPNPGKRLTYKFLYYSPNLVSVTIDKICQKKPRRAKLYYMQELFGKAART